LTESLGALSGQFPDTHIWQSQSAAGASVRKISKVELLPEAFAVAREASVRTMHMRPFDVQLIGGMVLHDGNIAEMRTGEGKTLMSTLPAYLNAISDDGVHIVTVNEYLAQRDADWMRPIYEFLGLTVGVSKSGQTQDEKRTQQTTNSDSTICVTTSPSQRLTRYNAI